ncbi:hypothetical protein JXJ21_23010 [candidate division KSB1 bacterium]|nr:hypothetical protein [candidate division KSB1 bacterium]
MSQSKHILISLLDRHPQNLTKTLFALHAKQKVPISEIWILTTSQDKTVLWTRLMKPGKGYLDCFYRDYNINASSIDFRLDTILEGADIVKGIPTGTNSCQEKDFIEGLFRFLKEKTNRDDIALHCVLSTTDRLLNVYFAFALQFFGRAVDKLYQLSIKPPQFESRRDFPYPPPVAYDLPTEDGNRFSTTQIEIALSEIYYVRLRTRIEYLFGTSNLSFGEMVRLTHEELERAPNLPVMIVDRQQRKLVIGNKSIMLTPIEFSIYRYYLERNKLRPKSIPARNYEQYFEGADGFFLSQRGTDRIMQIYQEYVSEYQLGAYKDSLKKGPLPFEKACQYFSRIKRKIKIALQNEGRAEFYVISPVGRYRKKYGIKLDNEKIIIK